MEATRDCATERTYSLGAVARLTGLSPHVLRAWERRYAAVQPQRSPGGTRRYREADVDRLRQLRSAVLAGHSISEVASASPDELAKRLALRPVSPAPALGPILAAAEQLDASELARLLGRQLAALGASDFIHHVAVPLLAELGNRWASGTLCVASEHLASTTLRSLLGAALRPRSESFRSAPILFTTLPGDTHELGPVMAAVIASDAGAHAIFVGGDLPISEIADAALLIGAAAVAVGATYDAGASHDGGILALRQAVPQGTEIWIGGGAAATLHLPTGVTYVADLGELERKITLLRERRE